MVFFLGKGLTKYPFTHKKAKGNNTDTTSNDPKLKDGGDVAEIGWEAIPSKVFGDDLSCDNQVIAGHKLANKNEKSGKGHHADILKP